MLSWSAPSKRLIAQVKVMLQNSLHCVRTRLPSASGEQTCFSTSPIKCARQFSVSKLAIRRLAHFASCSPPGQRKHTDVPVQPTATLDDLHNTKGEACLDPLSTSRPSQRNHPRCRRNRPGVHVDRFRPEIEVGFAGMLTRKEKNCARATVQVGMEGIYYLPWPVTRERPSEEV
jgi:hypothetical protein